MEKYGFVYLWFDRKHKRYYVGCRWGDVNDGYICSSSWMKKAYKLRKEDFRRRILKSKIAIRKDMFLEEERWISMIKESEIKPNTIYPRYYNLNIKNNKVWHKYDERIKTVGEKISASKNGKSTGPCSLEKAKAISEAKKKKFEEKMQITGSKISEETRKKLSENAKGNKHTEEWKKQNSERLKEQWANGDRKSNGPLSEETKRKISESSKGRKLSSEQIEIMKYNNSDRYIITKMDGSIIEVLGLKNFAKENNIPYQSLHVYYRKRKPMTKYQIQKIEKL